MCCTTKPSRYVCMYIFVAQYEKIELTCTHTYPTISLNWNFNNFYMDKSTLSIYIRILWILDVDYQYKCNTLYRTCVHSVHRRQDEYIYLKQGFVYISPVSLCQDTFAVNAITSTYTYVCIYMYASKINVRSMVCIPCPLKMVSFYSIQISTVVMY